MAGGPQISAVELNFISQRLNTTSIQTVAFCPLSGFKRVKQGLPKESTNLIVDKKLREHEEEAKSIYTLNRWEQMTRVYSLVNIITMK